MNFKLTDLNSFEDNIRREWALTNGSEAMPEVL